MIYIPAYTSKFQMKITHIDYVSWILGFFNPLLTEKRKKRLVPPVLMHKEKTENYYGTIPKIDGSDVEQKERCNV